jgi:two-component system OmpR family sensor kinase
LLHHERKAFLKFFFIYFISVALLILAVGFLYFEQIKVHYLKSEEFSIIEYARHIKMKKSLSSFSKEYHYEFDNKNNKHIDIRNFTITDKEFIKLIPIKRNRGYLKIIKSRKSYDANLLSLKMQVILAQFVLLLLFAFISYRLAKSALKPLKESISTLDKFAKDLIHDLNTPVTSIQLNMKLLEKNRELEGNSAIKRLKKSVNTISELHENLTILLQEETFQMQYQLLCSTIEEVALTQKQIYPTIRFDIDCVGFKAKVNTKAFEQILQNIISNACKYNSKNGYIKIYTKEDSLYIEDSGEGIEEPNKIFERSYSTKESSGIGLDIVKRLSNAMEIEIEVQSSLKGTLFILKWMKT